MILSQTKKYFVRADGQGKSFKILSNWVELNEMIFQSSIDFWRAKKSQWSQSKGLNQLETYLFDGVLRNIYQKILFKSLNVKITTTQDLIISQRWNSGQLTILMPRFQILVFQGAEMASLSKKCQRKFQFFAKKSCCDLTKNFHWF